jgi:hypothetical protein
MILPISETSTEQCDDPHFAPKIFMKILTDILDIGFEKPEFSRQMRKA